MKSAHLTVRNRNVLGAVLAALLAIGGRSDSAEPVVLTEEIVTRFAPANNGAGPLWCYGSPLVVRDGDVVYASIIETGKDVAPLCNTRWQLWRRLDRQWQIVSQEQDFRQREPCPLVRLHRTGLFLSANPSTQPPGAHYGPCQPTILLLLRGHETSPPRLELPAWSDDANFTDHSYRGLAADSGLGELLLLHIDAKTSEQYVSFRDKHGLWHAKGKIKFPIRAAYPQVALRGGAAHVMAIGDIREPVEAWRKKKHEKLKREWDYVFRRLFYTFTSDISAEHFSDPMEVDSVEETAGHITNLDLHIDHQGAAHLLYLKRPHLYDFLRDEYFPGEPMTTSLEYVVIQRGRVVDRTTLVSSHLQGDGVEPMYARFHVAPAEQLHVVMSTTVKDAHGATRVAMLEQTIKPRLRPTKELKLDHPLRTFFTSSPRGGCSPSITMDLFGVAEDVPNLRYAAIRLPPDTAGLPSR